MLLTIFGATGGIGRHLLTQALDAGHTVTAVVRNPRALPAQPHRTIVADLARPEPAALQDAVAGDAVLSAFGAHGPRTAGITAPGTRAIIAAMHSTGTRRIVAVSAAPVYTTASPARPDPPRHDPADGPAMRYLAAPLARLVLGGVFRDLAVMEDELRDSGLQWTVVRPPRLDDAPLTGTYRTATDANPRRARIVGRADVAAFMLRTVSDADSAGHAYGISR